MLEALFEGAAVGMAFWDSGLRYRRVNARLAEIHGIARNEHIGRTPTELLGQLGARAEALLRDVRDTGEPITETSISGEMPGAPGVKRHWQASLIPVGDGVGGVVIEVTSGVNGSE